MSFPDPRLGCSPKALPHAGLEPKGGAACRRGWTEWQVHDSQSRDSAHGSQRIVARMLRRKHRLGAPTVFLLEVIVKGDNNDGTAKQIPPHPPTPRY